MNELINKSCSYTFMTTRALTSLGSIFKDVNLKQPIIVMNGVSIYHPDTREYTNIKCINHETRFKIEEILFSLDIDFFTYLINNGILNCYYNKLEHQGSINYHNDRKNGLYYSFTEALTPKKLDVAQFVIVEKDELVNDIVSSLKAINIDEECNIIVYPYNKIKGFSFLKINSKIANKETAVEEIKKSSKASYLLVIGSGHTDIETMKKADFSVCLESAPDYIKEVADYILDSSKPEELLRFIYKIYLHPNYKNYLESLKTTQK